MFERTYCRSRRIELQTSQRGHSTRATATALEALRLPSGADSSISSPAFPPCWRGTTQGQQRQRCPRDTSCIQDRPSETKKVIASLSWEPDVTGTPNCTVVELTCALESFARPHTLGLLPRCHTFTIWDIEPHKVRQRCSGLLRCPTRARRNVHRLCNAAPTRPPLSSTAFDELSRHSKQLAASLGSSVLWQHMHGRTGKLVVIKETYTGDSSATVSRRCSFSSHPDVH